MSFSIQQSTQQIPPSGRAAKASMRRRTRAGTVIVCVLACLMVVAALSALALRSTLQSRRVAKTALRMVQANWLLDAGIAHARHKINQSMDYTGETYNLVPEELAGFNGRLHIETATSPLAEVTEQQSFSVKVTAEVWEATAAGIDNVNSSAKENSALETSTSYVDSTRVRQSFEFQYNRQP